MPFVQEGGEEVSIKSTFAELLNNLDAMQESPAYAVRKEVLGRAERVIVDLESQRDKLLAALKEVCDRDWTYSGAEEMSAMNAARIVIAEIEAAK
jgi:hypothetical protein